MPDCLVRAAAVQMNSTGEMEENLATADALVRAAVRAGAELVALPEMWNLIGPAELLAAGAEPPDGPSLTWAGEIARELGIDLVAGSIILREPGAERAGNVSVHFGPDGERRAAYRKVHLFDVEVEGRVYRESDGQAPGAEVVLSRLGGGGELGLAICYDLRFPELFRALAVRGARVISLPSAFTLPTTRDHWEVLVRARAIEEECFLLAPNQIGAHPGGLRSGGRSLIVDPWGVVLAQAPDAPGFITAELDLARVDVVRRELPVLEHLRPEVYA